MKDFHCKSTPRDQIGTIRFQSRVAGVAGAGRAAAIRCRLGRRGGVEKDYDMCSGLGVYRMGGAAITEWGAVVRGRVGRVCGHPCGGTCVAKSLGGAR